MRGSITKSVGKRGISWYATVELPPDPVTGKRRQKRLSAPTKRALEERIREVLNQADNRALVGYDRITVAEFTRRWLESVEPNPRPSTFRRYQDIMNGHVLPLIGHIKLVKLSPLDIQRLYADRIASGLSSTTVHLLHVVLHRTLKQAVRWGMVPRNVTEMVDPPRRTSPEITTWSSDQVADFFAATDQHYLAAFWRLRLPTGMRRGELLRLKWEDIDLTRGSLAVRRTISRGKSGTWEIGEPKTASGRRSIAVPQSCTAPLRKHRVDQNKERLRLGELWGNHGFVFTNRTGRPLHVNSLAFQFEKLTKATGLPKIRFQDLRHTGATLLLAKGSHPKIVQERLGHSDISMTLNRYSHVTPDMQRLAAEALDEAFSTAP